MAEGWIENAVQLNWNIGAGEWVQAKYSFSTPVDLSQKDIFGISLHGSAGSSNRISIMLADVNGVFFGTECDGVNAVSRWMINLPFPKKLFYHFFTIGPDPNLNEIDWSQIDRFFVVIKKISGGSGQLRIDHVQADRAADWPRQQTFSKIIPDTSAQRKAAQYILNQQKSTGLILSWKEEPEPKSWLYDQALALIVLTREGTWGAGSRANNFATAARALANFVSSTQEADGHWPRAWNPETGEELLDDQWVGDQSWWLMALMEYATKSGDTIAGDSAQRGADWLATKIDADGKVAFSTEGNVDAWWAMTAAGRAAESDVIRDYLLTEVWDSELQYWWRGRDANGRADAVVAMDCATWLSEFARSSNVDRPEMAHAALRFVRRTLTTSDDSGLRCGFDGLGPVSIWCEGTAQYVSAGGEDAQEFLNMLLSLQRKDGGMPGSPDDWSSDAFGWLTSWTGIAPTAWLYFALTRPPFPATVIDGVEDAALLPVDILLLQNYPNPFNPSTRIDYYLPVAGRVKIVIYNLAGQTVKILVDQHQTAGWHSRIFEADGLAAGVYFSRLMLNERFPTAHKLVLIK